MRTRRLGSASAFESRLRRCCTGVVSLAIAFALACAGPAPDGQAPEASAPKAARPVERTADLEFLLGQELEAEGRIDEAMQAYERALSKDPDSVYLLKHLAELAARRNRLSDALEWAERAYQLAPDDEGVALFLGTLYRLRKDPENAERVLRGADGDPIGGDAALLLYGVYTDSGELERARAVAEWLVSTEPSSLRGWFAMSDVLERQGDPEGAETALRRALERHPGEIALYGALARSRRDRDDRAGEIEIYEEVLAHEPDHHATLLALAEAQLALEQVDEALATLRTVEELHPNDVRSSLRIAFIELERGNLEEARPRFESALVVNPEAWEVAYFLGRTLRELGEDDEAVAVLEAIPADNSRFVDARAQIATILEGRGDLAGAIDAVAQAREAGDSRALDIYYASLLARGGDVDEALELLRSLLADTPDDPELLYNIGVIQGEAKRVDEAIGTMQSVLVLDPEHAGALNYVGYTWAERGENLDQAEEMITRALALRPDDGYITDSLGWVYYMRARPFYDAGRVAEGELLLERAIEQLQRAVELTGGDPVVSEHLGDVYLLQGNPREALRMYEQSVELTPRPNEQPHLFDKLERLRQELGVR